MSYERAKGESASTAIRAHFGDLARLTDDVVVILKPPAMPHKQTKAHYQKIAAIISAPLFAGGYLLRDGRDEARLAKMSALADAINKPFVALSQALYHQSDRRPLADVLCCLRHKTTLDKAGHLLARNAEQVLRTPQETARLWKGYEPALEATKTIGGLCDFSLSELSYEYPEEILSKGRSAIDELDYQTWRGADERYPDGVPDIVQGYLRKELMLVRKLQYAPFFSLSLMWCALPEAAISYVRAGGLPPIQPFVTVLALPLLTRRDQSLCSNALSVRHGTSHLILMLILNMKDVKRLSNIFIINMAVTALVWRRLLSPIVAAVPCARLPKSLASAVMPKALFHLKYGGVAILILMKNLSKKQG